MGTLTLTSEPIGPIGAWEEFSQTVGALLGSGWSDPTATVGSGSDLYGYGGSASPPINLDVTAPIGSETFLSDLFGDSASSGASAAAADLSGSAATAATDLSSLVQDFVSLF